MARRGKPHGRCGTYWEGRPSEETPTLTGAALAACRVMPEQRSVTAPSTVLCGWLGRDSVRLDLEGHGREALFDDIDVSRTVGRFTTLHPDSDKPLCWTGHPDEAGAQPNLES